MVTLTVDGIVLMTKVQASRIYLSSLLDGDGGDDDCGHDDDDEVVMDSTSFKSHLSAYHF